MQISLLMENKLEFGILIVDDDASSLDSLSRSLRRLKHKVYCCDDPQQVEFILQNSHVSMILTDIMMPELNGFELTRKIHHDYPNLKIYGYTGFYREEFEIEGTCCGLKRILSKPLDLRELNTIILKEKQSEK